MVVLARTCQKMLTAQSAGFEMALQTLREQLAASEARYQSVMADLRVVTGIVPRRTSNAPTPDAEAPSVPPRPPTQLEREAALARTPRQFQVAAQAEMARKWAEQEMLEASAAARAVNSASETVS